MHKHIIVKQHEGGFFSNFNKVISFLEKNSNTEKITWDLRGQSFGAFAFNCGEVFSHLFSPYNTNKICDQEEILKEYMEEGIIEESPDYKNFYRLKKIVE